MKRIKIQWAATAAALLLLFNSCGDYLNVAPDNIATLDYAFRLRSEAEKYLYTCYSYMSQEGATREDPAIFGGDEIWLLDNNFSIAALNLARGYQNVNNPLFGHYWTQMYQGIRVCNTFLENSGKVPDLPAWERKEWEGEAVFLKAWYHFYLVRMYGPIPLVRENLPISSGPDRAKVSRNTVDECFDYIVELLDLAMEKLPDKIENPVRYMGRITRPIAAAVKAKVLVTAASPLYNGNTDQATLKNRDGTPLFNTSHSTEKWSRAQQACKEAVEICRAGNYELYKFRTTATLSDTIIREMTIRNGFCEKWNSGVIWANTQTSDAVFWDNQRRATANLDTRYLDNAGLESVAQPPLKIAEMYYTDNGVPITEDKSWNTADLFELRKGTDAEKYYIKKDYTTVRLHFNREPRFYASLGFDGGIWYGQGRNGNNPDEYFYVACRMGGAQQKKGQYWGPVTGYYWKKCINYLNVQPSISAYDTEYYPWPIFRLADLYLLYAEAINEAEGPSGANSGELFKYIDLVRENAGLKGVKYSWDNYTENPKYNTKDGMKKIIHRERLIELSLEGQRFWDLRRWKEVHEAYSVGIEGYKITESDPEQFYKKVTLWNQTFNLKDYFWPIAVADIEQNPNLVQNTGGW